MNYAIGIDLGGTSIKATAITPGGESLGHSLVPFRPDEPGDWAEKIQSVVKMLQTGQAAKAAWIGLAAPGLAAADGRSIAHMPGRLQGLERLDWTEFLKTNKPVLVLNDAHAALLGEVWLGAARSLDDCILLTLGSGVGGAILAGGKLLRGRIGRAGHLGHASLDPEGRPDICGMPGSLEDAIGNCTIAQRSAGRFQTTHDLVKAHLAGDAAATEVWLKSVKALACAVASFINILDSEAVIIGGGIARCGDALFEPLEKYLREVEWQPGGQRVKVLPAKLGEFAGSIGAAGQVIRQNGGKTADKWRVNLVPYVQKEH